MTIVIPTYGPPDVTLRRGRAAPADGRPGPGSHRGRRRRQRARAPGAAARRSTGVELDLAERNAGFAANVNRGIARSRPGLRRRAAQQRRDRPARVARGAAVGRLLAQRRRDRRAQAALPRRPHPVGRLATATSARRSGSTTATASSPPTTARRTCPTPRSAMTGACMYVKRDAARRDRPLRRGLRDGLRGRRLVPARLGGGLRGASTTRGARADPPRVASRAGPRSGERELRLADALLGALGRLVRRARRADAGRPPADRLRDRGHRRRRRPPRHLRAPQPARARAATTSALYTLGGAARLVRPRRARCARFEDYDELAAALAADRRDQGRDLVEHRAAGLARVGPRGIPVFFVQDIETSYYPDDPSDAATHVLAQLPRRSSAT